MRENGPESAPEGHGRAPRADLQYLRASTDRQGASGLGLDAPREPFDRHIPGARGKAAAGAQWGRGRQEQRLTTTTALSFGSAGSKSGSVRPSASRAVWGSRRERLGGAKTRAGRSFRAITSTARAGRHRPKASRLPPPPVGPSEPRSNMGGQGAGAG